MLPVIALIDTHCHLDEEAFNIDRADMLSRAHDAGVRGLVTIGTTLLTSQRAIALAEQQPSVYAAVGIHPNYTVEARAGDWEQVLQLAGHPRVVAIGETGLDRYWDTAPLDVQFEYFRRHLALARELGKPFVVHCREAEAETLAVLREAGAAGPLVGVMHSFAGRWDTAQECLDLGLYLSFAGMTTYKKSGPLRDVVARVPADRILIETDAPYLAPQPVRGKRNEPAFVRHTAQILADLRGVSLAEFARQTTDNACRLFGLPQERPGTGT